MGALLANARVVVMVSLLVVAAYFLGQRSAAKPGGGGGGASSTTLLGAMSAIASSPAGHGAGDKPIGASEMNTELNTVVEPGTSLEDILDGSVRSQILDETEKVQGFQESYPTYDLKATSPEEEREMEEDMDTKAVDAIVQSNKIDKLVKEELQQEAKDTVLHGIKFTDQADYDKAPYVKVPYPKLMRQPLWWALKIYEKYYSTYPVKSFIPHLDPKVRLTPELFHEHFRRHGVPVVISVESLRHLGYKTKAWTWDQLREAFPYNETKAMSVVADYRANGVRKDDEEIDLGPGLAAILRDEKLAKKGVLRNYPRNLHVKPEALRKLQYEIPPLIDTKTGWQLPTLWLGTSSADTPFHHDCCDNFVLMVAGVKRFTLAPPTDWRTLSPNCVGAAKSLCWAKVSDPHSTSLDAKARNIVAESHILTVDLQPGQILYMPAGWWHHVKNLGPTVMINQWTRSSQICGLCAAVKKSRV